MDRAKALIVAAVAAALAAGYAAPARALERKPVLTLEMAKRMADACEAAQKHAGWRPVNIAIFDDGGNLKLFRRQDDAFVGSVEVSQLKGRTSAVFPVSTRAVGERSFGKEGAPPQTPGIAFVPGVASFPGGLPVFTADGHHIGGIGVSGATSDEDEACGQAAIDAIADELR